MGRHILISVLAPVLALSLVAGSVAGCASRQEQTDAPGRALPPAPADPPPVLVAASGATVDLGGGARLVVPPGAITPGATVRPRYSGTRPSGAWNDLNPLAAPLELVADPPDAIHGELRLEFPVATNAPGADQADGVGIATFDPNTSAWTPFPSTYDPTRHLVVASIPHFSWWNPVSWDWASIAARANQNIEQVLGQRAAPPSCTSGQPAWVSNLAGVVDDADVAIRSCAQTKDGMLDVEMVNNRPYGQVLDYGAPVNWGWHEPGGSSKDQQRNRYADRMVSRNQLYLPPLSRASVGVPKWDGGAAKRDFRVGPTKGSLALDFIYQAADIALDHMPSPGGCVSTATTFVAEKLPAAIRDDLLSAGGCLENLFTAAVASGAVDKVPAARLGATFAGLKKASIVGRYWTFAGVVWKFSDLFADAVLVGGAGPLGAGFSVLERSAATTSPVGGPVSGTPSPPGSGTTPTPGGGSQGPAGELNETVGGFARTHANPANAGGAEGPGITGGTSVQVSCRRQGFIVADGNPWWYRVASSPWNNNFWVSADAFYNNGRTTGPLKGTPFLDPAIPTC